MEQRDGSCKIKKSDETKNMLHVYTFEEKL